MADRYDLVIVGMGSAGMVGAEFAATIGVRTAVIERGRVGGDCLWTGCVPSKSLLASAKAAHVMRTADKYGLPSVVPEVDTELVWKRIRAIQHEVASTDDDPKRYEDMGIDILRGTARLTGPNTLDVDGRTIETRYVLLSTGSRPAVPAIEGPGRRLHHEREPLRARAGTREHGDDRRRPIAIEMAQGFTRLGIRTTVLQKGSGILPRDEPELVRVLTAKLIEEGVDLRLDVDTERVTVGAGGKTVHGTEKGEPASWTAAELLVAVGRRPNIEGLGLEAVGIATGPRGQGRRAHAHQREVGLRQRRRGRPLPLHPRRGYEAVRAIRDMFFPGKGQGA